MRVAVLEWICGSGCVDFDQSDEDAPADSDCEHTESLKAMLAEGCGMLRSVSTSLAEAGYEVEVAVSRRLPRSEYVELPQHPAIAVTSVEAQTQDQAITEWIQIAASCDFAIVIAPEIERILETVLESLRDAGCKLLNCTETFLRNASDKLLTARCLQGASVRHPPTVILSALTTDWLQEYRSADGGEWAVKSRWGADCQDLYLTRDPLSLQLDLEAPDEWIVQPWFSGRSFSRSVFVDFRGHATAFPPMEQKLERVGSDATNLTKLRFLKVAPSDLGPPSLDNKSELAELLGVGAYGWIGFDWVLDPQGHWWLIECNPRFTSSVVFLSDGGRKSLVESFATLKT